KSTLADLYSRTVNAQRPLGEVIAEYFPWCEPHVEAIATIFGAYVQRKRQVRGLDLDDLLLYWQALGRHAQAGPALAGMFDHVLVDEYQDVNGLQVAIVASLLHTHRSLTEVGDDFQPISGFRAA